MPDRSGLPSAVLGAGAPRLGAPAGVLGTPGDGYFTHCPRAGEDVITSAASRAVNILVLPCLPSRAVMTPPAVDVVRRDSIADVGVDDAALGYLTGEPGAPRMS
jgi:hypothetical protein